MSDILDQVLGDEPPATAPTPAPAEPSPDGPARGADGKFVAKGEASPPPAAASPEPTTAAAAPTEPAAPAPAASPAEPPPGFVPIGVVQELRNELKALKQPPAQPRPAPDPSQDLEGYMAHQAAAMASANVEWSYRLAVQQHGEEQARAAREWAAERADHDQAFHDLVVRQSDPMGYIMGEYRRFQALDTLSNPDTLKSFLAWQAAQAGQSAPKAPAASAAPPQQAPAPPPSLAGAGNAGGTPPGAQPVYPGGAFDRVFT